MDQDRQNQLDQYFKKQGGYKTKNQREEFWTEDKMQSEVCAYMRENHPNIKFFSDMSGAHLSKSQATKFSNARADDFKVPDMIFFAEGDKPDLCLELKKLSVKLFVKSGALASNEHIKAQARSLKHLRNCGKVADFSVGYVDTISKINQWIEYGRFSYLLK